MAWTPGFDFRELKRERGLLCVREAADSWARLGRGSIEDDVFLAVIIRLLLAPEAYRALPVEHGSLGGNSIPDLPVRPLEEWRDAVGSPYEECRRRAVAESRATGLVADMRHCVTQAANRWSLGHPEKPETEAVFRDLARILDRYGLLDWWGESSGAKP